MKKGAKAKPDFLFVDVDDLILRIEADGTVILRKDAFEKINEKLRELNILPQNVRFIINPQHYHVDAYELLRLLYTEAEKKRIPSKGRDGFLKGYDDGKLITYTNIENFNADINKGKIVVFSLRSPFEKALDEIKWAIVAEFEAAVNERERAKSQKSEETKVKEISERIVESLGLRQKMQKLALEDTGIISRGEGKVTQEERALINILTPALDPEPPNRPSLHAIRIQLARKMAENDPSTQQKANTTIEECSLRIRDEIMNDLANLDKNSPKYEERRDSHGIPGVSSLYNLAKAIGKSLRGRGKREQQILEIKTAIQTYKDVPNENNVFYLYRTLCDVENKIKAEHNLFESGLKQLCQYYKRELKAVYPEIAARVEKEIEGESSKKSSSRHSLK